MEWKLVPDARLAVVLPTLETSLVEWKRGQGVLERDGPANLGNFLSGMETE